LGRKVLVSPQSPSSPSYSPTPAGLSSSLPVQLDEILSIVTTALSSVSSFRRSRVQQQIKAEQMHKAQQANEEIKREKIRKGIWHDGRLDCVSGNGVMSELGIGDERMGDDDSSVVTGALEIHADEKDKEERVQRTVRNMQANGLPIVVIKNYASKGGTTNEELLTVLAGWAATLVENQVDSVWMIKLCYIDFHTDRTCSRGQ
jgi:RNA12 protein